MADVSVLPARPTTYRGIRMRSRLEAGYAEWLDRNGLEWEYEPCAFGGRFGQWLPDFVIRDVRCCWLDADHDVYIEVKPQFLFEEPEHYDQLDNAMKRMLSVYESIPDAIPVLQAPGGELSEHAITWHVYGDDRGEVFWRDLTWIHAGAQPWLGEPYSRDQDGPWTFRWWEG